MKKISSSARFYPQYDLRDIQYAYAVMREKYLNKMWGKLSGYIGGASANGNNREEVKSSGNSQVTTLPEVRSRWNSWIDLSSISAPALPVTLIDRVKRVAAIAEDEAMSTLDRVSIKKKSANENFVILCKKTSLSKFRAMIYLETLSDSELDELCVCIKTTRESDLLSYFPRQNRGMLEQLLDCINLEKAARQIAVQLKLIVQRCELEGSAKTNREFDAILQSEIRILKLPDQKGLEAYVPTTLASPPLKSSQLIEEVELGFLKSWNPLFIAIGRLDNEDQACLFHSLSAERLGTLYVAIGSPELQEEAPFVQLLGNVKKNLIEEFVNRMKEFDVKMRWLLGNQNVTASQELSDVLISASEAVFIDRICRIEPWYEEQSYELMVQKSLGEIGCLLCKFIESKSTFTPISKEGLLALMEMNNLLPSLVRRLVDREHLRRTMHEKLQRIAELCERGQSELAQEQFDDYKRQIVGLRFFKNIEAYSEGDEMTLREVVLLQRNVLNALPGSEQRQILRLMSIDELRDLDKIGNEIKLTKNISKELTEKRIAKRAVEMAEVVSQYIVGVAALYLQLLETDTSDLIASSEALIQFETVMQFSTFGKEFGAADFDLSEFRKRSFKMGLGVLSKEDRRSVHRKMTTSRNELLAGVHNGERSLLGDMIASMDEFSEEFGL